MQHSPRLEDDIRARLYADPLSVEDAVQDYLDAIDSIPGYPWALEYDAAKCRIADALLARMDLPLGPSEQQSGRWHYTRAAVGSVSPRPISVETRMRIYRRDGFACLECGSIESLTLDHKRPRSKGGSDDDENLQTLCRSCNSRKGDRWEE